MAGRSRSPPLAFIAPSTLPSFAPGSFALQQVPFYNRGADVGHTGTGVPPSAAPFSSSSSSTETETQALASLHEKYHNLLSFERQGKDLERSIWEAERLLFVQRIATLEGTVRDLQDQLGKPQSEVAVVTDAPQSQPEDMVVATTTSTTATTAIDLPGGLVDTQPGVAVATAPHVDDETKNEHIVEHVVEVPSSAPVDPIVAHEDSPAEEPRDEPIRTDSPGLPEYPYPKTPKSVKGDVEPDESEIVNLLDQAGRILGKASYGMHHYENDYDDEEEDFKLILKPNRNFRSNWAF